MTLEQRLAARGRDCLADREARTSIDLHRLPVPGGPFDEEHRAPTPAGRAQPISLDQSFGHCLPLDRLDDGHAGSQYGRDWLGAGHLPRAAHLYVAPVLATGGQAHGGQRADDAAVIPPQPYQRDVVMSGQGLGLSPCGQVPLRAPAG